MLRRTLSTMTRALWGGRWSPSLLLVPNLPAPTRPARRPRLVQPALHDSPPREPRCITGLGRGRERTRAARGAARRRRARAALGLAPFSWPVCCNNLVLIVCHREMKSVLVIIDGNYIRLLFKDGPAQESGDTRTLTCMCSRDTSAHSGDGRRPRSVHHGVRCTVAARRTQLAGLPKTPTEPPGQRLYTQDPAGRCFPNEESFVCKRALFGTNMNFIEDYRSSQNVCKWSRSSSTL